ncbi:glucosaminidase domain-containing protein [[Clostridium] innocuum]|uniref:glucosaminidase domain-containing protein n=1 Tax=Clostridium innocuum TaxID=1522 RepID=UPI003DA46AEC
MKPSDFVSTSGQKQDMSQSLLQTEMTDAVNSGIVGRADKSEKSLKSGLYSVGKKASTGGATSAALAAVTKSHGGRKDSTSTAIKNNVINGALSDSELEGADTVYYGGKGTYRAVRGIQKRIGARASTDGKPTTEKIQLKRQLKNALKGTSVNAAREAISGTELEGADTVYYGGKGTYRAVRGIQKRIAGKDALSSKKSLGKLSEKKSQSKSMDTLEAKRKAQAKGYFKKTVYDTAEKVKAAAVAEKTIGGKVLVSKGGSGLLMSVAPIILPVLIMAMLVIILFLGILGGIAGDDAQKKASLDGMPSWVTYDLVLSCLKAHEEYGYPPSALLGQMMIENGTSDEGSDLGRLYHNYGGVKYFGTIDGLITGSVSMLTTEYINGRPVQMYCNFAVFASDAAYMKYRCEYLYKQPNYTSVPNFQKAIDEKNSELFLKALGEGGYYTASTDSYVAQYRSICEAYPLVPRLDSMTSEEFENGFGNAFYPGGGQDYASAEQWQKDIVNACSRVSWPGASLCATWTSRVYAAAGHPCSGNGNSVLGHQGYGASYYPSRATTDLSQIKVGMLVSAQFGSNTAAGNTYGHVGIYIGDGMVMDSVNSGIRTISLSEWVSQNGRGWVVCGYPWDWR